MNRNYGSSWWDKDVEPSEIRDGSDNPKDDTYWGPEAFSEPETRAIRDLILNTNMDFQAVLSYHSYGQYILYPWGYKANNTLEYWSVDTVDNEELPHKILTGIKLDKAAPTIGVSSRMPGNDVEPDQEVRVSVNVTDLVSGVKTVTLYYTNDTVWHSAPMALNDTSALWETIIPEHMEGTQVKYRIEAYDNAGNMAVEDNDGQYYTYTVIPEFPTATILPLFMILSAIAIVSAKKKTHKKQKPKP